MVLVVVPLLVLNKYVRICLNILRDTEPPLLMRQFGFSPMDGDERDFFAPDGIRLRATIYAANPDGWVTAQGHDCLSPQSSRVRAERRRVIVARSGRQATIFCRSTFGGRGMHPPKKDTNRGNGRAIGKSAI